MPPSTYFWVRFTSSPERSETDQYRMLELGAMGAEEEGAAPAVRGCFGDQDAWSGARIALADCPGLEWGESPWEDWDRTWRERQIPMDATAQLTICPPWVAAPAHVPHVIRLEAKMAFGTGSHESTRIAAMLLENLPMNGKSLLDVGTGTGLLSFYAGRLGASLAVGFDIDPVTGPCLRENLGLNPPPPGSRAIFFTGTSDALRSSARFGVVIANLIRTEVWPHLDALLSHLKPGGILAISGQRVEDQSYWREWFEAKGIKPLREIEMEGWWGFILNIPAPLPSPSPLAPLPR